VDKVWCSYNDKAVGACDQCCGCVETSEHILYEGKALGGMGTCPVLRTVYATLMIRWHGETYGFTLNFLESFISGIF
jgi:hypothetical protein